MVQGGMVMKIPQYAEMTGLSQSVVRSMCEKGMLEAFKSKDGEKGGHWYIRYVPPDMVSRAEYDKILLENAELKTKVQAIQTILFSEVKREKVGV